MKKKLLTVLFAATVAASILGGCGAPQETGGRAEGTEQTRESGESQETENAAEALEADEPERLVRPDDLEFDYWLEWEYDGSGNQTKAMEYESDGNIAAWAEYGYDEAGNRTKEIIYKSDGGIEGWGDYEYDKSGNQTKYVAYYSNGSSAGRMEWEYDKAGNQTKCISYGSDGNIDQWEEYEYNKSGNQTKCAYYDSGGNIDEWEEYEYNKSGSPTICVHYDSNGDIIERKEYEYNKSGNLTKCVHYDSVEGVTDRWHEEWEYDQSGNPTKYVKYNSDGDIKQWVEYEYDESYNRVKEISYVGGIKMIQISPDDLTIPEEIQSQSEMLGYLNLALFTVGTAEDNKLVEGENSNSIIIISINKATGDTRLVSVCQDTYLNLGTDSYGNCDRVYAEGGPVQAIRMLNRNLELNIENFISIGYTGLINIIDGLGGIYIDVDTEDLEHLNNTQSDIAGTVYGDSGSYTPVEMAGAQILNGLQATAYFFCDEDAYQSAMKQREVYMAIGEQMKNQDSAALSQLFDSTINNVYTSVDTQDLLELICHIAAYQTIEEENFPQKEMSEQINISSSGMSLVPIDLETNVIWLHRFLFDDEAHEASQTVKEISDHIKTETN